MRDDAAADILAHIVSEWQRLKPMGNAPPPRGVWILQHEPVPAETELGITTPVTAAWYGNAQGVHERKVDAVRHLRANSKAWVGRPYHRWGWVDYARLETEPVYHLDFMWGSLYGYGVQAAVTDSGLVLTSPHLWRS